MSLERLVSTIITEAKSLLKCDRCTVYLLDLGDTVIDAIFKDLLAFIWATFLDARKYRKLGQYKWKPAQFYFNSRALGSEKDIQVSIITGNWKDCTRDSKIGP